MGWNIFGGIASDVEKALGTAYKDTKKGLYDLSRGSETVGYELGTALRTGHFIPLNKAYKQSGQATVNIPFLGKVSGEQLAKTSASYGTQALPFVGTFGHLASHPNENAFQKGSDIAFGIADIVPFGGDVASAFKKPIETGISDVAHILRNGLRGGDVGLPRYIGLPRLPPRGLFQTPLPILGRVDNFIKSVSKDVKFIAPIDKLPTEIHGILNDVAKTVRSDLKVVGAAIDEDPAHIIAHDAQGVLHSIGIAKNGTISHFVEDFGGGAKKVGEAVIQGGQDLFKTVRNGIDSIVPITTKIDNFLKSGKLLGSLAGLGIGLSVAGGLSTAASTTPTTSTTSGITSSTSTQSSGYSVGGLGTAVGGAGGAEQCDPTCGGNPELPPCAQCGPLGQMNAGNVLQSQLQTLSQSAPQTSQNAPVMPISYPTVSPTVSTAMPSSPGPISYPTVSPTTSHSIFSNTTLLIVIAIVVIVIILIAVMRQ